ncbi:histone RNA hairpin-binding protein [Chironomus tepperi]|uniref:histone RNA hairpin-binding protein n=1 Tax=Chironomus tepperi TaxID=113505 RepID=UPI00391FB0F6
MSNNQSWLDLLDSSNSSDACNKSLNKTPTDIKNSSFKAHDDEEAQFIEIFDAENQKKFDKMTSDKKIKSPFKRRLENEVTEKQVEKKFKESNDKNDKQAEEEDSDDDENNKKPRKRFCSERSESSSNCSSTNFVKQEIETDQATLDRRQKQIDYGKNTIGYDNYMKEVPKHKRTRDHPKTPPKHLKYSRRAWEGLIKSWRKKLHTFDPTNEDNDVQD